MSIMECFRRMTNDCIRIGLEFERRGHRVTSKQTLASLVYQELRSRYGGYSGYVLGAISRAAGILSARRKSIMRGFPTKTPYSKRPTLLSCYGFSVKDGSLVIHIDAKTFESIPLNSHTRELLSSNPEVRVRSFTLSPNSLSLCISKEVEDKEVEKSRVGAMGIDRNLAILAVGDSRLVTFYDITKAVKIAENSRGVVSSFKRNDFRISRRIASKYGRRRKERVQQLLNIVSKRVVEDAKKRRESLVFEDIRSIRGLYRRGNGQGRSFRAKMNSWSFYEIKRQIEYKAAWEGVPVFTLTKGDTRGTTMDCPRCGERLQVPVRGDEKHHRQLWCIFCKRWRDRDLIAVLNISRRGWLRFDHSSKEGEAGEAVKGNAEQDVEPLILRVDASKLCRVSSAQQNLASAGASP